MQSCASENPRNIPLFNHTLIMKTRSNIHAALNKNTFHQSRAVLTSCRVVDLAVLVKTSLNKIY